MLLYPPDIKYITKFEIEEITEFSDHCGISFSVQCNEEELSDSNNNVNPQTMYIVFDETKVDRFMQDLSLKNESFSLLTNELESSNNVDNVTQQFVSILQDCCSLHVFGKNPLER